MGLFIILKALYSADKIGTELYGNTKFNDLEKLLTNIFLTSVQNFLILFILTPTKNISHISSLFVLLLEK